MTLKNNVKIGSFYLKIHCNNDLILKITETKKNNKNKIIMVSHSHFYI